MHSGEDWLFFFKESCKPLALSAEASAKAGYALHASALLLYASAIDQ
jgi:hypothetical protein